jgi:predicted phage tail protein
MPKRKLLTVKDFEEFFKQEKDLIFDATEQRIQRPSNYEQQKETYSGKKKPIH